MQGSSSQSYYTFAGQQYFSDPQIGAGFSSFVSAVSNAQEMDGEIQRYAAEYRQKASLGKGLALAGLSVVLGGLIYDMATPHQTMDLSHSLVMIGADLGGLLICGIGLNWAGPPTDLVTYYNRRYIPAK